MKFGKVAILAFCAVAVIAACNKKTDDTPTPSTPNTPTTTQKDYLIAGKWQITSIKTQSILGNSDLCDTMPACRKDNTAVFAASSKIFSDEGATKCNSSSPQVDSSGTWSMTSDFKKLTANVSWVPTSNKTFDVLELTSTSLKIAQSFDTTVNIAGSPFLVHVLDTVFAKNIK